MNEGVQPRTAIAAREAVTLQLSERDPGREANYSATLRKYKPPAAIPAPTARRTRDPQGSG